MKNTILKKASDSILKKISDSNIIKKQSDSNVVKKSSDKGKQFILILKLYSRIIKIVEK